MVESWRIVKARYAEEAFSGEGARRAGGRFNSPGTAVIYTASSLALAELEILVNLPTPRLLGSYVAFRVSIPDEHVETLDPADLPENWRADPAPRAVKTVGDRWVRAGRSLVLAVPSAVVPAERNYLLNPRPAAFEALTIDGPFNPEIDPRLR